MPPESPTPPVPDVSSGSEMPGLYRKVALMAAATSLAVLLPVIAIQLLLRKDGQYAGNWINGISAVIAALNLLLTFFILRAALGQLDHLRRDLNAREIAHQAELKEREERRAQEAEQARTELENTQRLLTTQTEALALARSDAQKAHRETAKTRLDLLAPRCTVTLSSVGVTLFPYNTQDGILVAEDSVIKDGVDNTRLEIAYTFTVENWGDLPVYCSLGSPWNEELWGQNVLQPKSTMKIQWVSRHFLRHWVKIARGEFEASNYAEGQHPALTELLVGVSNIGHDVYDLFRWAMILTPITVREFDIVVHSSEDQLKRSPKLAVPKRQYVPLAEADKEE